LKAAGYYLPMTQSEQMLGGHSLAGFLLIDNVSYVESIF
jgi:hypothetical protein